MGETLHFFCTSDCFIMYKRKNTGNTLDFFFNEIKIKTVLRAQNYLVNREERTEPSSARLPPAVPDVLHGHPLVTGVPA